MCEGAMAIATDAVQRLVMQLQQVLMIGAVRAMTLGTSTMQQRVQMMMASEHSMRLVSSLLQKLLKLLQARQQQAYSSSSNRSHNQLQVWVSYGICSMDLAQTELRSRSRKVFIHIYLQHLFNPFADCPQT